MRTAAILLAATALVASACHDKRPAEGPLEYSGRKADEGAEKAKDGAEKAAHDTKCAAKNAKDGIKKEPRDPDCD